MHIDFESRRIPVKTTRIANLLHTAWLTPIFIAFIVINVYNKANLIGNKFLYCKTLGVNKKTKTISRKAPSFEHFVPTLYMCNTIICHMCVWRKRKRIRKTRVGEKIREWLLMTPPFPWQWFDSDCTPFNVPNLITTCCNYITELLLWSLLMVIVTASEVIRTKKSYEIGCIKREYANKKKCILLKL